MGNVTRTPRGGSLLGKRPASAGSRNFVLVVIEENLIRDEAISVLGGDGYELVGLRGYDELSDYVLSVIRLGRPLPDLILLETNGNPNHRDHIATVFKSAACEIPVVLLCDTPGRKGMDDAWRWGDIVSVRPYLWHRVRCAAALLMLRKQQRMGQLAH